MSGKTFTRRRILGTTATGMIGALVLSTQIDSANAQINTETSYNINDETTEYTGELESVRLVVDADVSYQSEKEISTLGMTLSVGPSEASDLETLDTSIVQQSSTEKTLSQSLSANLGEVVALSELADTTTEFQSELYLFIESDGQRVAEETLEKPFTVTLEDGSIESSLGISAEGEIEVSVSG